MKGRRTLVTGAGGFVGANLIRRLRSEGAEVHAAVRPGAPPWRFADLENDVVVHPVDLVASDAARRLVDDVRPHLVFHLAAYGAYSWQRDLRAMVEMNVLATQALLDACQQAEVERVVHAGSSSEYGDKDGAPAEDELLEPNSHYAVTKAAATHLCALAARTGPPVVTLRLYSVYGPWEDPGRLVPTLLRLALRGELPPLVDPSTPRDFVYVDDVTEAFVRAATVPLPSPHRIYNIGSGQQSTVGDLVALVRSRLGVVTEPRWGVHAPRAWDLRTWVADPGRAREELGWEAVTTLDQGLESTIGWMRAGVGAPTDG
ncbi:MAG: NAD-dependent epimerase/dehydratase family protein [Actinomycetota bacterium]|nr:NAD-dependent epimerase/dehydratase family protein [Actinomycetota bacterium]